MKKIIIFFCISILYLNIQAQNQFDALRYSQHFYTGTARFSAMGSSFGGLGADLSVLSTNPAGIAIYQRSELSVTPSLSYNQTVADYSGRSMTDNKYGFNLGNIGFVGTFKDDSESNEWKNVNFGISYNKLSDFNQGILIEGTNNKGSMLESFARNLSGYNSSDVLNYYENDLPELYSIYAEALAWDCYLLDQVPNSNPAVYSTIYNGNYGETQRKSIINTGKMGEFAFSFGANYSHILYIGGTFGLQNINYTQSSSYKEINNNAAVNLNFFEFKQNISTTGSGANFKFGAIFRPIEAVRIGMAIHSPTFYNLTDEWNYSMTANYKTPLTINGQPSSTISAPPNSDKIKSEYQLTSPLKMIASLGVIIPRLAALNFEYEYVDFSTARLDSKDYNYETENSNIQTQFTVASNFRAGAEFMFGPVRLRGGYAIYGSPYNKDFLSLDASRTSISGGIGLNTKLFYMDMAYIYSKNKETSPLYDGFVDEPVPTLNITRTEIMLTLGIRF